jgi:nitrate reductase alpha subunit
MLSLVLLCGCQGVNGGGWAHYVGQEKVRPITGWSTIAFAGDWNRPPRQQATTPYWFLMSDQWRYQRTKAGEFASALGSGSLRDLHMADCVALSARLGWMPSYPSFDRNPLDLCDDAAAEGLEVPEYVVRELREGRLRFAAEDPDAPENHPRVLTLWRANLLGSSSKGHEYFLRHVLGVEDAAIRNEEAPPELRSRDVVWREEAPVGKFDLFTTIDFRMNGSALYSDVVLPAATWYEKHDLSSTDLHPFVHPFTAAVPPPWETRTDFDVFRRVAERFSELARTHLGARRDLVAAPLLHDTPDELAQPLGLVRDWKAGECEPVPGKTMPKLVVVERDYGAVLDKWLALGPLVEELGVQAKGVAWKPAAEVEELRSRNGVVTDGPGAGRPRLDRDVHVCEAILALSAVTNGRLALEGFRTLEERVGLPLADLGADHAGERISFGDVQVQPRRVIASPEWSGSESAERRYSPFTVNVDRLVPWRTLTGRQHFYVDHAWLLEFGEGLPVFRPPIDVLRHVGEQHSGDPGRKEVHLKFLTPHSKWSIHSEFQDNLTMLTLFRGGPTVWLAPADAEEAEVVDNDWVEVFNRNGVIVCRAVVSHRIPAGTALMYHSQDRHVNVPRSELSKTRGGTDNSVTRISIKPTLLVGGYAQLSYGFNYYGPTGSQRDEIVLVRKLEGEVTY